MARDAGISTQLVGAFGEKIVEAELLRRGWLPANANATVSNAARFDIFAQKGNNLVAIQVKACGPKNQAFFSRFSADWEASEKEFTILVKMGETREGDQIFVIPTYEFYNDIKKFRNAAINAGIKDIGTWDLCLPENRAKKPYLQLKYGFAQKWKEWRDNWDQLEPTRSSAGTETSSIAVE